MATLRRQNTQNVYNDHDRHGTAGRQTTEQGRRGKEKADKLAMERDLLAKPRPENRGEFKLIKSPISNHDDLSIFYVFSK